MDVAQIVTVVMGVLVPLGTEALKGALTSGAEEAGKTAGKGAGEGIIALLRKFLGREKQEAALEAVQATPESEKARENLKFQIEQLAKYAPDFIPEMTAAIEGLPLGVRQKLEVGGKIEGNTRQSARSRGPIVQDIKAGDIHGDTVQDAENG